MRNASAIIFAVVFSLLLVGTAICAPNMQDGLWEITTTIDMKGLPPAAMKPMTHTTCLTQKNAVPDKPQKPECKMTHNFEGNTVTWTMTCPDTSGRGRITYSGTTFDGYMESTTTRGGEKGQMRSTMKGRRIGPCNQ